MEELSLVCKKKEKGPWIPYSVVSIKKGKGDERRKGKRKKKARTRTLSTNRKEGGGVGASYHSPHIRKNKKGGRGRKGLH